MLEVLGTFASSQKGLLGTLATRECWGLSVSGFVKLREFAGVNIFENFGP